MTTIDARVRGAGSALVAHWRGFWFRSEAAYTLGLVRIAFGVVLVLWTLWLYRSLYTGFGTEGIAPRPPSRQFVWGVFHLFPTDEALLIGWFLLLAAGIALAVGWHSRLAAVLAFVLILSFERRNPGIFNGGDALLRIEAIFLALAPCGAALSLDQRRRTGSFWSAQQFRPWPLRLMQVQLSVIYLATVVEKLSGETWQNGTAVSFSLRQSDLLLIPIPTWLSHNLVVSNVLTWGTLVIELMIAIFVWNRRWRPWVLAAGVVMHLSISAAIEVGFFTPITLILYLAFTPPEKAQALADGARVRLTVLKSRILRRETAWTPRAGGGAEGRAERIIAEDSDGLDEVRARTVRPLTGRATRDHRQPADRLQEASSVLNDHLDTRDNDEPSGRRGRHAKPEVLPGV